MLAWLAVLVALVALVLLSGLLPCWLAGLLACWLAGLLACCCRTTGLLACLLPWLTMGSSQGAVFDTCVFKKGQAEEETVINHCSSGI